MTAGANAEADPAPDEPAESDEQTILVVEDHPQVRQIVCDTLADEGWRVRAAQNGQQAIDLAAQQRPALVVLDMALPIRDGFAVAGRLRSSYGAALPILVISGDGHSAAKAARVGAYAYLRKPFDLGLLVAEVRRGLGRG